MAAQPGVTLVFTVTSVSTQLSPGLTNRHGFLIQNNDQANAIAVGFGTGNNATVAMFIVLPGSVFTIDSGIASGTGMQAGPSAPTSDISAIAVSGSPSIAFMEW